MNYLGCSSEEISLRNPSREKRGKILSGTDGMNLVEPDSLRPAQNASGRDCDSRGES